MHNVDRPTTTTKKINLLKVTDDQMVQFKSYGTIKEYKKKLLQTPHYRKMKNNF